MQAIVYLIVYLNSLSEGTKSQFYLNKLIQTKCKALATVYHIVLQWTAHCCVNTHSYITWCTAVKS